MMPPRYLRRLLALACVLALSSCGGATKPRGSVTPAAVTQENDLGLEELRKSLESTVLENYTQLSYGNVEAFVDGVSMERDLQLVGVTPKDVLVGVNPPGLLRDRRLYRHRINDGLQMLSKNLDVHLSMDGSVGWVYDEMSYRIMYMGREASIPIRVTGVYVRDVERWVLVAEHMSYGVAIDDIINLKARGSLGLGKSIKTDYGTSKELAAYLVGLVGAFTNKGLPAVAEKPVEDVLVLLPGPEQEFHASDAYNAPTLASVFGAQGSASLSEFRVQVAPSKRMAWILANVSVKAEQNGDEIEISLRGSFVLERRHGQEWDLVQAHISAPLLERQLSERVFGPNE